MSDLIDRESVMEIILMPQNVSIIEQLEMLKKLPSAQKWIPVTERLPENDVEVIATGVYMDHNQYVEIASCNDGRWSSYMDEYKVNPTLHKIIAWMPLPEPYKELVNET